MKKPLIALSLLAGGTAVAALARRRPEAGHRLASKAKERRGSHMERILARMPENSPPRLIMKTLPRLARQNEEILELLREDHRRLRELTSKVEAA